MTLLSACLPRPEALKLHPRQRYAVAEALIIEVTLIIRNKHIGKIINTCLLDILKE